MGGGQEAGVLAAGAVVWDFQDLDVGTVASRARWASVSMSPARSALKPGLRATRTTLALLIVVPSSFGERGGRCRVGPGSRGSGRLCAIAGLVRRGGSGALRCSGPRGLRWRGSSAPRGPCGGGGRRTPLMWSACGWVRMRSGTSVTWRRRRQRSTRAGSGPVSTTTACPGPVDKARASPWPTSQATSCQPGGGQPGAIARMAMTPIRTPVMAAAAITRRRLLRRIRNAAVPVARRAAAPRRRRSGDGRVGQRRGGAGDPDDPADGQAGGPHDQPGEGQRDEGGHGAEGAEEGGGRYGGGGQQVREDGDDAHLAGEHHQDRGHGDLGGGRDGEGVGEGPGSRRARRSATAVPGPASGRREDGEGEAVRAGTFRVDQDEEEDGRRQRGKTLAFPAGEQRQQADHAHDRRPQDARFRSRDEDEGQHREDGHGRGAAAAEPGETAQPEDRPDDDRQVRAGDDQEVGEPGGPEVLRQRGVEAGGVTDDHARQDRAPVGRQPVHRGPQSRPDVLGRALRRGRRAEDGGRPRTITTADRRPAPLGGTNRPRSRTAGWGRGAASGVARDEQHRDANLRPPHRLRSCADDDGAQPFPGFARGSPVTTASAVAYRLSTCEVVDRSVLHGGRPERHPARRRRRAPQHDTQDDPPPARHAGSPAAPIPSSAEIHPCRRTLRPPQRRGRRASRQREVRAAVAARA